MACFVSKFKLFKEQLIKTFASHNQIADVCLNILLILFMNQNQLKECIILTSLQKEIDDNLNEIKSKMLKSYSLVISFLFELKKQIPYQQFRFFLNLPNAINLLWTSLINYLNCNHISIIKESEVWIFFLSFFIFYKE